MRGLIALVLVALVSILPVTGSAQTSQSPAAGVAGAPSGSAAAPASPARAGTGVIDETTRVLAVGLGAVTGMVLLSVVSTNMITGTALANLGQGVVVFAGTVVGGLVGNWLYLR